MINPAVSFAVQGVVNQLAQQHVNVEAANPSTVIGALNAPFPYASDSTSLDELFKHVVEISTNFNTIDLPHDALMNVFADDFSKVLNARLGFVRNDLIPFVSNLVSDIGVRLTDDGFITPEIIQDIGPEIFSSDILNNMVSYHTNSDEIACGMTDMSVRSGTEVITLLETGSPTLNALVAEMLEYYNMNEGVLENLFSRFFIRGEMVESVYGYELPFSIREAEMIAIYLMARNIQAHNIVDASEKIDLTTRRARLANFVNKTGHYIARVIGRVKETTDDMNCLVTKLDKGNNRVYVNPVAYRHFLTNLGGSPEALLGALATNNNRYDCRASSIIERKQILENFWDVSWKSKVSALEETKIVNTYTAFMQAVHKVLTGKEPNTADTNCVALESDDEQKKLSDLGNLQELTKITFEDFERAYLRQRALERTVMELICQFVLKDMNLTSFLTFLNVENNENDSRVKAYHFVIRELTDHLAQLLDYQALR